jgi:hypothetical protein
VQVAPEPKVVVAAPVPNFTSPVKTMPLPEQVQPQVVVAAPVQISAEPENSTAPASKTQEDGIVLPLVLLGILGFVLSQLWSAAIKTCNWARDRMRSAPPQYSTVGQWKTRYNFDDWNCTEMSVALVDFVLGQDREVDALFAKILHAMQGVDQLHQALFVANCARTYLTRSDFDGCDFYQVTRNYYSAYTTREYAVSTSHFKSNFLSDQYTLLRSQLSIPYQKVFTATNRRYYNEDSRRWRESQPS